MGLSAVGPLRLNPTAASPPRARKHEGEDRTPLEAPRPAGGVAAGLAGPARGRLERGSSFSRPSGHDSDDMAAKGTSWLGEFWRPLAALLLWVVGLVPAIAAPPLLPVLAETRVGGLTAFPVDCIPAVPLFSSDLTRACGPPLYDSASGCSVAAKSGGRVKLNIFGEGEAAPGYVDVSTSARFANGRPLTQTFESGSAQEIFVRNSPITGPGTLAEMQRLAAPGGRITVLQPAEAHQAQSLLDAFGGRAAVTLDRTYTSQTFPGQVMREVQVRVGGP
mgnify:CR=1 FL=1